MSMITDSWMRLRSLLSKRERDRQIGAELEEHFNELVRDLVERGLSPINARAEATSRFGDVRVIRKELRSMEAQRINREQRSTYFEELSQDIRYGVRQLLKRPAFTAIVIGTLAIGIGANTAVFSVLKGVFLDPLPFDEPQELTYIWHGGTDGGCCGPLSGPDYLDIKEGTETFEDIAVMVTRNTNLNSDGEPVMVLGARITPNLFSLLRVSPAMGRPFTEDDQIVGNRAVILSDGIWRNRLGGDPAVIGSTIRLNRETYSVVGVMPAGFNAPSPWRLNRTHDIYFPFAKEEIDQAARNSHWLLAIGRLKRDVPVETGDAELKSISESLAEQYPNTNRVKTTYVHSMHERLVGRVGTQLILLLSAAGFMLLIVCGNVASLLLSRATARQTEMAIRAAVGAGRLRIIRQLLTESLLLSTVGGGAGIALAVAGMTYLRSVIPTDIPRITNIGIDGMVLGFALLISIVTGILFGLAPALSASHSNLTESLKEGRAAPQAGARRAVLRGALVASQFALALILANGAALMVQSYLQFRGQEQGFDPESVLTVNVSLQGESYEDVWDRDHFLREAINRISGIPGVRHVGATSKLPMNGGTNGHVWAEDDPERDPTGDGPLIEFSRVSGDYFTAAGIELVAGRLPAADDSIAARPGTVINQEMAERLWPDENPIGKRYSFRTDPPHWMTVVGVVEDVRQWGPYTRARAEHYLPYTAPGWAQGNRMYLIVKTDVDPLSIVGQVRQAVLAVDPDQPISEIRTMEGVLSEEFAGQRFNTMLVGIFAGIALLLVSAGVYGVVSFFVAQTSREIGIRMALGAAQSKVLGLTILRGLRLAAIGTAVGVGGIFATTRVIRSLLYGASAVDVPTMIGGVVALICVGLFASLVPARRAARVSPVTALRSD
jgi:predicted permease